MAIKISACTITKNEEKNMPSWLKCMQEVADDLDLTVSAISRYESGERIPQDDIKKRLAAYYKRSVGGIFFTD